MNRKNANEFRAVLGLMPLAVTPTQLRAEADRKRRQAANRAARAAQNQALKASRSRNGR